MSTPSVMLRDVRRCQRRRGERGVRQLDQAADRHVDEAAGRVRRELLERLRGARRGIDGDRERRIRCAAAASGLVQHDAAADPVAGQVRIADVERDVEVLRGAGAERELARRHR